MLKIYNTLVRKKEEFIPIDKNTVKMYSCGPTVYSEAHIGNMRAYIFVDSLRKVLKYNGYKLLNVMNITDVGHLTSDEDYGEDKIELQAKKLAISPCEVAAKYTKIFFDDCSKLNIERPEHVTPATEYIKEMEEYVAKIMENGYAYETPNGIYFDTEKLKTYGELSKINKEKQMAGARIEVDEYKKNPFDFAIWIKAPKEHIMKWPSRWGVCYPGWHIECSAMANKFFGEKFDIHTGGADHINIHHENEIAQSRGAYGVNPANYWMHNEFILIDGGKMGKSLHNDYKLTDLIKKGYDPLAYRYLTYTTIYRNKLNFTWEGLDGAKNALLKVRDGYQEHLKGDAKVDENIINEYRKRFGDAINDDLNFPVALSIIWEIVKNKPKSKDYAKLLVDFDKVLSLDLDKESIKDSGNEIENNPEIQEILYQRQLARENKDFAMSDKLRDDLLNKGYRTIDSKDGQKIERV